MKKRTRNNATATSAVAMESNAAEIEVAAATEIAAAEIEVAAATEIAAAAEPTSEELKAEAKALREKAAAMQPKLEELDATKLDAAKLKELSKQIAESEKLEKQAEKLEKQANAKAKQAAKAILEAAKSNEVKETEKFLVVCEEIARAEREFVTLQNANAKMHQSATWAFNALTDTDFLIDRELHVDTIFTFESISKQLDSFNELTSELAKQAQDKMRALYIANVEAVASSQMKRARKAIGVKANEQMQAIVNSEQSDEATSDEASEAIAA